MKSPLVFALALTFASCEIRIGPHGSGVFFSKYTIESTDEDGSSIFLRGKGSYSWRNGRLGKLGDGSRVYFLREEGKPEQSEIFAMRRGDTLETAVLRQGKVEPLSAADRSWLEDKIDIDDLNVTTAPGIDQENGRLAALRDSLSSPSIDWKKVDADLSAVLFPSGLLPEIVQVAQREKIGPEDEKGLLHLVDRNEVLFRHRDRDRIVEAVIARSDLSPAGISAFVANLDAMSYGKRTQTALKLVEKPSFDSAAAHSLLACVDDVPYDGRAGVLAALRQRGDICPQEDWLDTVLDQAPYDRRTKLVLDALAAPAAGKTRGDLAHAVVSRLDDFPYDRRSVVFSRCVEGGFEKEDVAKLVDRIFDDLPYNERLKALVSLTESPALGASAAREGIRRVDDLPYDSRDEFLIAAARRSDLDAGDHQRIVRQTLENVSYHSRTKVLRELLANPQCSAETKESIWRHRKNLPAGQREEIEELFRK